MIKDHSMVEFLLLPLILVMIKRRFPFFLDFNYPSYHCWIAMCFIRRLTPKFFVIIKWYGGNFCNFFCLWINYTKILRSNSYMYKTNLYVFYKHTICILSLLYFRKRESCDLILTRTGCLFSRFPPPLLPPPPEEDFSLLLAFYYYLKRK